MELLPLTDLSRTALANQGVADPACKAIQVVVTCLRDACWTVAEDCDRERHDDATSEGQLRWRRCRNQTMSVVEAGAVDGLEGIQVDLTDGALKLVADGTALSFYSARNGIDHPDLSGGRKAKRAIVTEMQQQLALGLDAESPRQLVVLYEADQDGLATAAVGMLREAKEWAWQINVFKREGVGIVDAEPTAQPDGPSYDAEPEPEIGGFTVFGGETDSDERSADDDG